MNQHDTIAALSTPAGLSARAIARLSGPKALSVAGRVFSADSGASLNGLPSFRAIEGHVALAGGARVPASLYLMRAPRSYTREDVAELHVPGSPLVAGLALAALLENGARLAGPGEFTRRALVSGRISAAQAEAVIAVIRARSRAELSAAAEDLAGRGGQALSGWRERAENLAALMEAELDYGEAAGEFLADAAARTALYALGVELDALIAREADGDAQPAGDGLLRAVLAGAANAGKSLLFRRLTGRMALVSEIPGTTRDVLSAPLLAAPNDLAVLDCAGLGAPPGEVAALALQAAERAWRAADLLILVIDSSRPFNPETTAPALSAAREAEIPVVIALNKCDLPPAAGFGSTTYLLPPTAYRLPPTVVQLSALTGTGCPELSAALVELLRSGQLERSASRESASARRREVLLDARRSLARAEAALEGGLGLACAADDLREAARAVALHFEPGAGRIGLDERVLNRIFARFCVGK